MDEKWLSETQAAHGFICIPAQFSSVYTDCIELIVERSNFRWWLFLQLVPQCSTLVLSIMTPQCNTNTYHYTKEPLLIKQTRTATLLTTNKINITKFKREQKEKKDSNTIKCVLVGDKAVGKTSLAVSYSTGLCPKEYTPTAYDNYNGKLSISFHVYLEKRRECCARIWTCCLLSSPSIYHTIGPVIDKTTPGLETSTSMSIIQIVRISHGGRLKKSALLILKTKRSADL